MRKQERSRRRIPYEDEVFPRFKVKGQKVVGKTIIVKLETLMPVGDGPVCVRRREHGGGA